MREERGERAARSAERTRCGTSKGSDECYTAYTPHPPSPVKKNKKTYDYRERLVSVFCPGTGKEGEPGFAVMSPTVVIGYTVTNGIRNWIYCNKR